MISTLGYFTRCMAAAVLSKTLNEVLGLRWKRRHISTGLVLGLAGVRALPGFEYTSARRSGLVHDVVAITGAPYKVALAAVMREVDREHLEYGTSPNTAWLTKKGKAFLLQERGKTE